MENITAEKYNKILTLQGNRKLYYTDLGNPEGPPVIYLPGFPGSRLEALFLEPMANNVRLISVDRPGIGNSDPLKDRTIRDYKDDISALADELELETFALAGTSGGAAYAYSLLEEMDHRITNCGIISGIGSPDVTIEQAKKGKFILKLWNSMPSLAKLATKYALGPSVATKEDLRQKCMKQVEEMSDPDKILFQEEEKFDLLCALYNDALQQGNSGPAYEFALYTSSWIVNYEILNSEKIFLYHGEKDHNSSIESAKKMVEKISIPNSLYFPGEGHWSLLLNHFAQILEDLTGVSEGSIDEDSASEDSANEDAENKENPAEE